MQCVVSYALQSVLACPGQHASLLHQLVAALRQYLLAAALHNTGVRFEAVLDRKQAEAGVPVVVLVEDSESEADAASVGSVHDDEETKSAGSKDDESECKSTADNGESNTDHEDDGQSDAVSSVDHAAQPRFAPNEEELRLLDVLRWETLEREALREDGLSREQVRSIVRN